MNIRDILYLLVLETILPFEPVINKSKRILQFTLYYMKLENLLEWFNWNTVLLNLNPVEISYQCGIYNLLEWIVFHIVLNIYWCVVDWITMFIWEKCSLSCHWCNSSSWLRHLTKAMITKTCHLAISISTMLVLVQGKSGLFYARYSSGEAHSLTYCANLCSILVF